MALLDSKQLNPNLTGSFILSGSTQTFIGASDFQGSITASGDISGSYTSTGSLGFLNVDGNAQIDGNTNIDGNITLGGNITVGDSDSDSISFGADISSSLIPDVNDKYNIGSDSKRWNDFYLSGSVSASGGPHHITSDTTIDLDAEGALTLDGGSITIGGDTDVAVDIDSTTLDIDASGALTLDSATSISIGTTADKPIDIDSTTLDIDASGAITIDGTSTILISGDGGATFSDDTEALVYDGSGNVDFDTVVLDIDSSGAITIDGTSTVAIAGASTSTYGDDTAVWSFNGSGAVSETGMTTFSLTPSSTVDIDAGGAVTIDGTSITIGGDDSGVAVSIGHSTSETTIGDDLTVTGDITGSSNLEISGNVSGSITSTGSFGRVEVTTADINGGTIDGITSLTAGGDLDIGAHDLRAETLTADSLTATRVPFAGTAGVLSDDSDLTFATATLSATNLTTTGTIKNMALVSGSSVSTGSFGRLEVVGNANIDGDITLGGDITIGGDISIGDSTGDSVSFEAEISSSLVPDADATYDLGSSSKGWNDLHLGSGGVINLDGGDVTLTHSSNLVTITGGTTRVDKLEIDGANDHIDVSTDMVLTAAADITLTPGGANVKPGSDSAIDLGVSGTAFRELFVDAIDLNGQGSISVGGTGRIDLDGDDDTSIRASADDIITFEAGAVDIAQMTTTMAVSGSSISTGSFGYVNVDGMSTPSLSEYSSSIATQLNTLTADVIALSIALG